MSCGEFDLITRFFHRQKDNRKDVRLGIGDDCALLVPVLQNELAISTDTLVCGTHFLPDISPADLGYKALAVNLSDLAAVGADPAWLSLAITLPEVNESWLSAFSDGLFSLLDYYGMQLIGGDTTRGPLSLTLTVHGWVPVNMALTRSGARAGDWIYVTGTLGDSAAGLAILLDKLDVNDQTDRRFLLERHLRPSPRVLAGQALRQLASSVLDLSDGLASDLGHILKASGCGAKVQLDKLPLSEALLRSCSREQAQQWALAGGEDYELCFTVSEKNREAVEKGLSALAQPCTCIGQITANGGFRLFDGEKPVESGARGYDHFQ